MSFVTDIQTIAKTRLLEEKVGKALNLAEIANQNAKANLLGERNTANQETTVQIPPNPSPISGVGTDGSLIIAPASSSSIPPIGIGGNISIPATLNPQNTTGGTGGGGGASSTTPTDLSGQAFGNPMLSGTMANTILNSTLQDPIALGIYNSMFAAGSSQADIYTALQIYFANKTDAAGNNSVEPGTVTTKQIADNLYPFPPASLLGSGNSFGDNITNGGPSAGTPAISVIAGYNPNGEISAKTGLVKTVIVRLDDRSYIPPISESFADGQYQEWASALPPAYIGWQFGYIWSINVSGGYASSAEGAMETEAAYVISLGLFDPSYTNLRPTAGSAPNYTQYQCDFVYYDTPGKDPAHKFDAPNTVIGRFTAATHPASASSTQPYYSAYPKSGTYYKNFIAGTFRTNPLDSEAPFVDKHTTTSQVLLGVGDGVNNIDGRFVQVKPGISGGLLLVTYPSLPTFSNGIPSVAPTSGIFLDSTLSVALPYIRGAELGFYTPQ